MARSAGLDVKSIVEAALLIADRESIDQLTMRRLSTELGVTPMAIYHHVRGKDELLDLVVDESIGQIPRLGTADEPRTALMEWFVALNLLLLKHPALAQTMAGRRLEGSQALRAATFLTSVAQSAGLDLDTAIELVVNAFRFTLGSGLYGTSRREARAERGARSLPAISAEGTDDERALRDRLAVAEAGRHDFDRGLALIIGGYLRADGPDEATQPLARTGSPAR